MNTLRPNLPRLPRSMQHLPIDDRGYPVPFFVEWINGKPEFRIASRGAMHRCVLLKLCWICGKPLGTFGLQAVAFVIGPMCSINRISSEPPQHPECAEFAVRACPFMLNPNMRRRENDLPTKADPPGIMNERNPGVMLIWITRNWKVLREPEGYLFEVGRSIRTVWYAQGRLASRAEVLASIESGLPFLRAVCTTTDDFADLEKRRLAAMRLVPHDIPERKPA
jgi:hypothetical protein